MIPSYVLSFISYRGMMQHGWHSPPLFSLIPFVHFHTHCVCPWVSSGHWNPLCVFDGSLQWESLMTSHSTLRSLGDRDDVISGSEMQPHTHTDTHTHSHTHTPSVSLPLCWSSLWCQMRCDPMSELEEAGAEPCWWTEHQQVQAANDWSKNCFLASQGEDNAVMSRKWHNQATRTNTSTVGF